ncbi:MAG: hypothetical protein JXQ29_16885 [Planctomycetes bacterium]|nr:hypothetical protein [Planctomycetota bacterium]
MRIVTAAAVLFLAGLAGAQTMMPIPVFGSTYSSASHSRGFYFQAPIDFTIVGLRVPDERSHGLQNVAVIKPAAKPPAYPTTTTGGYLFYKGGEPSSTIIPCNLSFKKGEFVGVLGACGDATMMYSSYGTPSGPFLSHVLGVATSIYRFGSQTNLVVVQGQGAYYCIDTGTVSRVEVYVAAAGLVGSGTGAPGTTLRFTLTAPADGGLPYQMGSSFGNGPIPIDTRRLGLSVDSLLVLSVAGALPAVFQNYAGKLDAQGVAQAALAIPNLPALKGLRIYTAYVTLLATAPSGVASISNSFLFTIQ